MFSSLSQGLSKQNNVQLEKNFILLYQNFNVHHVFAGERLTEESESSVCIQFHGGDMPLDLKFYDCQLWDVYSIMKVPQLTFEINLSPPHISYFLHQTEFWASYPATWGRRLHRLYVWYSGRSFAWGNSVSPAESRVKTSLMSFKFVPARISKAG